MKISIPNTPLTRSVADLEETILQQIADQHIKTKVLLQKVYEVKHALLEEQGIEKQTEGGIILG